MSAWYQHTKLGYPTAPSSRAWPWGLGLNTCVSLEHLGKEICDLSLEMGLSKNENRIGNKTFFLHSTTPAFQQDINRGWFTLSKGK